MSGERALIAGVYLVFASLVALTAVMAAQEPVMIYTSPQGPVPQEDVPQEPPPAPPPEPVAPVVPEPPPAPAPEPVIERPPFVPPAQHEALEALLHEKINVERADRGLEPYAHAGDLAGVARAHSGDMVARGYIAHVDPDGVGPQDRLSDICPAGGENIAMVSTHDGLEAAADAMVRGWIASPGHYANIVHAGFTAAGMGVAISGGSAYATHVFCVR